MKTFRFLLASISFFLIALVFIQCQQEELVVEDGAELVAITNKPSPVFPGNNLSFPVIWSDGYEKELRDPLSSDPMLADEWWYVWAEDPAEPTDPVYSCKPHPDDPTLCEDGTPPGDGTSTVYKAYLQKRFDNMWQAQNEVPEGTPFTIDLLDWGDNLESIDWNIRSQVRTELVFYENLDIPMLQYSMRHVSGWGVDEMHGLQATVENEPVLGPGNLATVYSHNLRFTIQKLNVPKDSITAENLTWVPNSGWTETDPNGEDLINEPLMNQAVYEASDGPGFFNAEVNIKGKIIYGYTWNVRKMNDGTGYYRITYSFDETGGIVPLNTFFDEDTEIIVPIEETLLSTDPGRGGVAKLDVDKNLTYMDVLIKASGGGGGGGGGNGGPH